MHFIVIDVETANADLASICQIGIVWFEDHCVSRRWQTFVDPEDEFDGWNVAIHGITEDTVRVRPTIATLAPELHGFLSAKIVASHMPFDRIAISRAMEKYGLPTVDCQWLDTARVARRAWADCSRSGYALGKITKTLGIEYQHHVAEEDARAAGEVLVRAITETGISVEDWLVRSLRPISSSGSGSSRVAQAGNPDGPLAGEMIVFTGALSLPRREAARLAAQIGCTVCDGVNGDTTLLVVGDQDVRRLAGSDKSSKHRKAEGLIKKGQSIRVLCESDFRRLVETDTTV